MEAKGSLPHSQVPTTCPHQHGMAHPQVAEGGTASTMEGSCKYIE